MVGRVLRKGDLWHGRPPWAWEAAEGVPVVEAMQEGAEAGSLRGQSTRYKVRCADASWVIYGLVDMMSLLRSIYRCYALPSN